MIATLLNLTFDAGKGWINRRRFCLLIGRRRGYGRYGLQIQPATAARIAIVAVFADAIGLNADKNTLGHHGHYHQTEYERYKETAFHGAWNHGIVKKPGETAFYLYQKVAMEFYHKNNIFPQKRGGLSHPHRSQIPTWDQSE